MTIGVCPEDVQQEDFKLRRRRVKRENIDPWIKREEEVHSHVKQVDIQEVIDLCTECDGRYSCSVHRSVISRSSISSACGCSCSPFSYILHLVQDMAIPSNGEETVKQDMIDLRTKDEHLLIIPSLWFDGLLHPHFLFIRVLLLLLLLFISSTSAPPVDIARKGWSTRAFPYTSMRVLFLLLNPRVTSIIPQM